MSMKKPAITLASLLAISLIGTGCATANGNPHTMIPAHAAAAHGDSKHAGKKHKEGKHHKAFGKAEREDGRNNLAALNLSEAQKAQLQQLRAQHQTQLQQLHTNLKQLDDTIVKQKQAGASNTSLLALYQQKKAVMQQANTLRLQQQQQFLAVLTPEQQLKWYETHAQGMKKPHGDARLPH